MKKIISAIVVIVISIFSLESCCILKCYLEYVPQNCIDFAMDISQYPEKTYNIKEYYPEFYNKKHFEYDMKDTNYIKKNIVEFCNEKFKGKTDRIIIQKMGYPSSVIKNWNRYNTPIKYYYKDDELLLFRLSIDNDTLNFLFVKEDGNYYIFRIYHGIIHADL